MRRAWGAHEVLFAVAVVVFVIAFCVAVGWFFHNWQAWLTAGCALTAAGLFFSPRS